MKRFISIMAIVALICTMAVTASASENTVSGVWKINETISTIDLTENVNFHTNGIDMTFVEVSSLDYISFGAYGNPYNMGEWADSNYRTWDFGTTPQNVSPDFYSWLTSNAVLMTTTADTKYTFGDAGPLSTTVVLNSGDVVNLREWLAENGYGAVVVRVPNTGIYMWVLPQNENVLYYNDDGTFMYDGNGFYHFLGYNQDDARWVDMTGAYTKGADNLSNIKWSTFDVIDFDDNKYSSADVNFIKAPLTLAEKIQAVTGEQMTGLTSKTVGTMKVLLLCGVGLMASLVVLKLFGKRSLIYRS